MKFELILVNDGSTDQSGQICEKYKLNDNRVIVIHQKNSGVTAARNAGLKVVSGRYIGFVDSDDLLVQGTFEKLVSVVDNGDNDAIDIIEFGNRRFSDEISKADMEQLQCIQDEVETTLYKPKDSLISVFTDGKITTMVCDKIYSIELLKDQWFDNKALFFAEDVLFLGQVLWKSKGLLKTDIIGYLYRQTPDSLVTVGLNNNKFDSSMYAYGKNRDFFKDKDNEIYELADAYICSSLINWRLRKNEISEGEIDFISRKIKMMIRMNIKGFVRNKNLNIKLKIVAVLSCASIKAIDFYRVLSH